MAHADGAAAAAAVDTPADPGPARASEAGAGARAVLPPRPGDRLRQALRDAAPALALYAVIRVIGLIALALLARQHGYGPFARLDTYDAPRLLDLARAGYDPLVPTRRPGRAATSNIAFFPLYPLVVRAVAVVPGVSLLAAGYLVTAVSGLLAAAGLDRFGRRLVGGRAGALLLVALWANWPHSAVLAMPYTEALYVALAVWSVLAVLDERWVSAGALALLAGATRSLGVALAAAVAVGAALALARARREGRALPWRPVAATALAPLGVLGYWAYQWARTGRPDAWFWVQAHEWRSYLDGGSSTAQGMARALGRGTPLVLVVCSLVVLASVALLVALAVGRAPLPVVVYTALATVLTVATANYLNSKARFLLCAFPLVLPLARALARVPRGARVALLTALTLLVAWYNAYVLVIWRFSP